MCVCVCVCVCVSHVSHVSGDSGVCVLRLLRYVYDIMSCSPIVSDRAANEGSKYIELRRQPHEFIFNSKYLFLLLLVLKV